MIRPFRCGLLLCAILSLAACGGGGGGGGGGISNGGDGSHLVQGPQQAPVQADSGDFDAGFDIGPFTSGTNSLTLIDPQNDVFAEFNDADFHSTTDTISDHKWLTAEIDMDTQKIIDNLDIFTYRPGAQTGTLNEYGDRKFTGTVTYGKQTLLINDRTANVALEHSTFGAWYYRATWTGDEADLDGKNPLHMAEGDPNYTQITYHPFYGADSSAPEVAPATGGTPFTGAAHAQFAQYMESGSYISEFRSGTASLSIGAVATTGNLELTFPNAYNIGFNDIAITNGGAISANYGDIPIITANDNTTGISLNSDDIWSREVELEGQFYGSGAAASEAAGAFSIGFRGDKEIRGSFGVKK
jgi:hypothetical protein